VLCTHAHAGHNDPQCMFHTCPLHAGCLMHGNGSSLWLHATRITRCLSHAIVACHLGRVCALKLAVEDAGGHALLAMDRGA
jgi:hypothetical protein